MTFPPGLPTDIEDAEVLRAHDWQSFREVDFMQNHWDRPGWSEGRRSYHWMLSFHDDPAVRDLALQCQTELDRPDFDPVPLDALHLTIGRVAFTDETVQTTVDRLVETASRECKKLAPFHLAVGPLAGSRGALRFTVAPWPPLLELHRTLADATQDVFGEADGMQTANFRPHVSIAYCNRISAVSELLPLVAQLRALDPVSTLVVAASLVELRREGRTYRYGELARMDLVGR